MSDYLFNLQPPPQHQQPHQPSQVQFRVNAGMLSQFIGQTIVLPGKVKKIQGPRTIILEASDHGNVPVHFNSDLPMDAKFMEVTGIAERDGSIQVIHFTTWQDDVDLNLLNDAIRYQFNYPELFNS